jgi:Flp pilus assembly protein TadG
MKLLAQWIARLAADRRGATLIEYAFAASVLVVIIVGILEFGRALFLQTQLQQAVSQAARCATVNNSACGTSTAIRSYAASQASSILSISSNSFVYTNASCGNQVTISYPFNFSIPFYGNVTMMINAQSCVPK